MELRLKFPPYWTTFVGSEGVPQAAGAGKSLTVSRSCRPYPLQCWPTSKLSAGAIVTWLYRGNQSPCDWHRGLLYRREHTANTISLVKGLLLERTWAQGAVGGGVEMCCFLNCLITILNYLNTEDTFLWEKSRNWERRCLLNWVIQSIPRGSSGIHPAVFLQNKALM